MWALFFTCLLFAPPPLEAQVVKIMPMGDSITRGSRGDGAGGRADIPGGYRKNLGQLIAAGGVAYDFVGDRNDNAAAGMDPHHNGLDGWRTDQMRDRLSIWMAKNPDVILLKAGTNDILQQKPLTQALENLENLMMEILMPRPDRRLFVATVIPIQSAWGDGTQAQHQANANIYNSEVRAIAGRHAAAGRNVFLVDLNQQVVLKNSDPAKNFFQPGDGIHPGQAGYDQLGSLWHAALTAVPGFANPPPTGVPAKRTGLAATTISPSRVNLSWNNPAADATSVEIWTRNLSGGVWQKSADAPGNATNHAITGLATHSNQYRIAINAVNAAGGSGWSAMVSSSLLAGGGVELAGQKPASASAEYSSSYSADKANDGVNSTLWASTGLLAHWWQVDLLSAQTLSRVEVVMRQDGSDVEAQRRHFEVRVSNDPTFATYTTLGGQGETPLPHNGTLAIDVVNPAAYRYLRVQKTVVESFSLAEVRVFRAADLSPPTAPTAIAATPLAADRVRLEWVIASDNETGFRIERKNGAEQPYAAVAMPAALVDVHDDEGVAPSTTYTYRVFALNEAGESAPSPELSVTTPAIADPPPASAPAKRTDLAATTVSPSRVNLIWNNPDTSADTLEIWIRAADGGAWQKSADLPGDATGHSITGLATQSTAYELTVNALNPAGGSGFSNTATSALFAVGSTELAAGKPATASAEFSSSHTAGKANDGSTATLWASIGTLTHWWQVDLQSASILSQVEVVMRQDQYDIPDQRRNFGIRVSNDPTFATYTTLGGQGASPLAHQATFTLNVTDPAAYRYLRVEKTVIESFAIAEVRVFGSPFIPPEGYDAWAAGFPEFMALPADQRLATADANGDGIPNLLAYAFGLDPLAPAAPERLPGMRRAEDGEDALAFTFVRNHAAGDLVYQPQRSGLAAGDDWLPLSLEAAEVAPVDGVPELERVTVFLPLSAAPAREFFRLKVTRAVGE